jgi:hypothetical protein
MRKKIFLAGQVPLLQATQLPTESHPLQPLNARDSMYSSLVGLDSRLYCPGITVYPPRPSTTGLFGSSSSSGRGVHYRNDIIGVVVVKKHFYV